MAKKIILKKLKLFDYILICVCICVAGISLFLALQNRGEGTQVIVSSPYNEWVYNIDDDQNLKFEGVLGLTHITIEEGQAFFKKSPCDNQICILNYPAYKNGDWAACLPNQIWIRIEGEDADSSKSMQNTDESVDAISF